jgi:hypothetical protein
MEREGCVVDRSTECVKIWFHEPGQGFEINNFQRIRGRVLEENL